MFIVLSNVWVNIYLVIPRLSDESGHGVTTFYSSILDLDLLYLDCIITPLRYEMQQNNN